MLMHLLACGGPDPAPSEENGPISLVSDAHVALPFVTAGDDPPESTVTVTAGGEDGAHRAVTFTVDGDFEVEGDDAPLYAGDTRVYGVRYTGDTTSPVIATGSVTFTSPGQETVTTLAAVVGDPDLPDTDWTTTLWGKQTTVPMPSAPFPYGDAPYDDSSVFLFYPEGLSDIGDVGVVAHLHGFNATLSEVVTAQRLAEQTALSGRDAILIVPQGPVEAEDGDFGKLDEPGGFATLVRDAVSILYRDGVLTRPTVGPVALTSHSGGYNAAADIVEDGGLPITAVHLFDSLYGREDTFQAFAEAGGVLRSSWTATGGTDAENRALAETLSDEGLDVADEFTDGSLLAGRVSIGEVDATHSGCVSDDRAYARWLAASGLRHRAGAPPELLSTVSDGTNTTVTWRLDASGAALRYRVEGSDDGARWSPLTDTDLGTATVAASPRIRVLTTSVTYGNSAPSDTYGGTGSDWLIVDGFDRALDGSYDAPTHVFAADLGGAFGAFSAASNEAVVEGLVRLEDYPRVLWMLGDEGLSDLTFDSTEEEIVRDYVEGGGTIVVSGSEVGYATDPDWLYDVLHATFVADDAGTTIVEDWTVGAAYDEDYPDVLDGDTTIWSWAGGGAAAVGWDGRVVVIGFGLENLDAEDLGEAAAELEEWLE